ncbi:MAG: putative anti-sigma regulatory factor, serine/threonine protein kinase, partial [Ilumatobacteraceae bacterium]|nr:putative anti-sigma regulatory factor, serine/threonine protein kinase [Ilumatobacteraceae bacterium]
DHRRSLTAAPYAASTVTRSDDPLADDRDEIRLSLPALFPYGRVARMAVTGLASRNGYGYDDVEDLRIAVGEVFGVLVAEEQPGARLHLRCVLLPDALDITACRLPPAPVEHITDLSRQILSAVVDESDIREAEGCIRIVKLLREGP